MKEVKALMKKENLVSAAVGAGAFAGSIIGIKKIQFLNDKPELKKILIPLLLIFIAFKMSKKPGIRFAVLAGAGIPLIRGIADYAKIKQGAEYLPIEMNGDETSYEVPVNSPEGRAMLAAVLQGEIEDTAQTVSGYLEDESSESAEALAMTV